MGSILSFYPYKRPLLLPVNINVLWQSSTSCESQSYRGEKTSFTLWKVVNLKMPPQVLLEHLLLHLVICVLSSPSGVVFFWFFLEAAFWSLRRNSEGADRLARHWDYPFLSREKVTEQTELYPDQNCFGPRAWQRGCTTQGSSISTLFSASYFRKPLCWTTAGFISTSCVNSGKKHLCWKSTRASQQRKAFSLF